MASAKLLIEVDAAELACRMLEAELQQRRPENGTAAEALAAVPPDARAGLLRAAVAAARYFGECVTNGIVPS